MLVLSTALSFAALLGLCIVVRHRRLSLGLPIAYLSLLLLNHLPGAVAHAFVDQNISYGVLTPTEYTEAGMFLTMIGAVCFVIGVAVAQVGRLPANLPFCALSPRFPRFCLYCGWLATFALSMFQLLPFLNIPSVGAAIDKGGALWILGALIGLRGAVSMGRLMQIVLWLAVIMVYPVIGLAATGFLSYGTAAAMIAMSALAVGARTLKRVFLGIVLFALLGTSLFANYAVARDNIRAVTWSDSGWEARIAVIINAFSDVEPLALSNPKHVQALDLRLNQNYFVGVAASRLDSGLVSYKWGWSLVEAAMSLVPRVIWPDKPVYGGSPAIVHEMTGLELAEGTSWGVGNVMEFYINFGMTGLVLGFVILGIVLGRLDRNAAISLAKGNLTGVIMRFLPAVALIQPLGSLVELASGSAAAFVGALAWAYAWQAYHRRVRVAQHPLQPRG
jgi:hypothetical protein